MTKTFKYLSCLLLGALAVGAWSCSADEYTMPDPNIQPSELVEGVAFTVEHDATNPNIIHLTSLMPASYQIAWETPQGRKTGATASLSIPFDGEYQVKMGVDTRGGYVWSEPYTFTIDDFCADFVDHYLWRRISGGVGQSKTWQLDLGILDDGTVKTTFWNGPHWFWNGNYTWDHLHAKTENENTYANFKDSDPWKKEDAINPATVPADADNDGEDWYWAADYAGNSWMCNGENYGYMILDMIGGANVTITDADGNVISKGTYMLDTDAHTITFSDCYPLNSGRDDHQIRSFNLYYLSDTAMQFAEAKNGNAASLNYVTKEYFENYTKPVPTTITLPDGWYSAFNSQIKYCSWILDEAAPYDWYDLGGTAKNGFKSLNDYPAAVAPVRDVLDSFKMNLCDPASGKYTAGDIAGNVTVAENGAISLSAGLGDILVGGSSVKFEGTDFRIVTVEIDDDGRVESFVLGQPVKDINGDLYEYLGYKFVADYGAEKVEKYRVNLAWANASFAFDYGEVYIQGDGQYSVTVNTTDPALYLLYMDVEKILAKNPNAEVIINSIKKDGVATDITDDMVERGVGDAPEILRRYIVNPWNEDTAPVMTPKLNGATSVTVDFTVHMDCGTPWVK